MSRIKRLLAFGLVLAFMPGCTLVEIRGKSKTGPEFRHRGSDRTNSIRWYAQQGFEFVWQDDRNNKITTGITYRRRDIDNGNSDNDNGVWLDFSFPIWKAKEKVNRTAQRIKLLERRITALEAERSQALARSFAQTEAATTPASLE
ncbi:MAG: hypothetical protein JSU63_13400 [Phycisphaerales bacterium]|nr:MAG: hypothetical protein JSU63_13400 [Phycisphaerales bacterium]